MVNTPTATPTGVVGTPTATSATIATPTPGTPTSGTPTSGTPTPATTPETTTNQNDNSRSDNSRSDSGRSDNSRRGSDNDDGPEESFFRSGSDSSARSAIGRTADSLPESAYNQPAGVLSSAPRGTVLPSVASQLPPRPPAVAAAQPRPGVLPFAGQAGHNLFGGLLGGLGLLSIGAALRLRGRRAAAEPASTDEGTTSASPPDASPSTEEQLS